jgi:hypothetical protein
MTEKFIRQKLNYIHLNPCSGKWKLALCPEDYLQSSAKFYSTGEQGIFPVTHVMQLMDVDLSNPLIDAESPLGDSAGT